MPKVGKKEFPYNAKGMAAAKAEAKKKAMPKKSSPIDGVAKRTKDPLSYVSKGSVRKKLLPIDGVAKRTKDPLSYVSKGSVRKKKMK